NRTLVFRRITNYRNYSKLHKFYIPNEACFVYLKTLQRNLERDMIVERTQEGKAVAKLNPNFKEGRPKKYNKKQIEHALFLLHNHSYKEVKEKIGISKSTLIRAKRQLKKESATEITVTS
ncbi:hypothetical protein NPM06_29735, partial [Bacillus cereus]|nr:hypothetical protein [Bacillus cereus]